MKFEKINENKIKITISLTDLAERKIDLDALSYNSPQAQELFLDMMERAEDEFGFDASNAQICVETIPSSSDGFIITITKMDGSDEFESLNKYIKNKFRKADSYSKKKAWQIRSAIMIYSFVDIEHVCSVVSKIFTMYLGESSLYQYNGVYYLILTRNNIFEINSKLFDAILSEYGSKIDNIPYYEGFLEEYAKCIVKGNAIETMVEWFK